jgi:hypothetical protein
VIDQRELDLDVEGCSADALPHGRCL